MAERILEELNPRQREAVLCFDRPLLVVAGAGSGKTRVITHKIAYLALERGLPPAAILGVTFTNKAAAEMKNRIEQLTGLPAHRFRISTFHALGLRLLRENALQAGFGPDWEVMDDAEQKRFFTDLEKNLNSWPRELKSEEVRRKINLAKMKGFFANNPEALRSCGFSLAERDIYGKYHEWQKERRLWDYEDLISLPVQLLTIREELRLHYRALFRYLVIDEFQDTNPNQYELIRLLVDPEAGAVTAVGDDDQSVYSWRGAEPRFLLEFEKDFPKALIIKLEQNYRSTARIIAFANQVISRNRQRRPKNMWTEAQPGAPVFLFKSRSKEEEAAAAADLVENLLQRFPEWQPILLLYRIHAQSLAFENEFRSRGIPVQILKGLSFFERREIKDSMAMLRLALNPADDYSFTRVCDALPLGIGPKTLAALKSTAAAQGTSMLESYLARPTRNEDTFFHRLAAGLADFNTRKLSDIFRRVLGFSEYLDLLESKNETERLLNIEELQEFISRWETEHPEEPFQHLMDSLALNAPSGKSNHRGPVFLASMHNAKGLEFPVVIAVGINHQYMPFFLSRDLDQLEEERRLFYVAATRARNLLVLSSGSPHISPFLGQIADNYYFSASGVGDVIRELGAGDETAEKPGLAVLHPVFGPGRVLEKLGEKKYLIEFQERGLKTIDAAVVPVEFL